LELKLLGQLFSVFAVFITLLLILGHKKYLPLADRCLVRSFRFSADGKQAHCMVRVVQQFLFFTQHSKRSLYSLRRGAKFLASLNEKLPSNRARRTARKSSYISHTCS